MPLGQRRGIRARKAGIAGLSIITQPRAAGKGHPTPCSPDAARPGAFGPAAREADETRRRGRGCGACRGREMGDVGPVRHGEGSR